MTSDPEIVSITVDQQLLRKLQSYITRDTMLPELEDVSESMLLHVAAVCVAESSISSNDDGESFRSEKKAASALDAVRQLAALYEKMIVDTTVRSDVDVTIEGKA